MTLPRTVLEIRVVFVAIKFTELPLTSDWVAALLFIAKNNLRSDFGTQLLWVVLVKGWRDKKDAGSGQEVHRSMPTTGK